MYLLFFLPTHKNRRNKALKEKKLTLFWYVIKKNVTLHLTMKQFLQIMRRYLSPYKSSLVWAVVLNIYSQVMNVVSFVVLIPILNILFQIDQKVYHYQEWTWSTLNKDLLVNNGYAYVQELMAQHGAFVTLCIMGGGLVVMTLLKTLGYFASLFVMLPLRTGIVKDIRMELYRKVLSLPLAFFSSERRGDIIARMSSDVGQVETSLTSSIDMLIRHPIAIIICFATMIFVSWQLTLFVIVVAPIAGIIMGQVSKRLKAQGTTAQRLWGNILSQLDETLGGLRIIKAFIAEKKMTDRFEAVNDTYRNAVITVSARQSLAHPMSEFLGTVIIVIVLLFGGWLILTGSRLIDASTFIFYMVILYSVINPLKEFTRAIYQVPLGLASMDRIDFILKAENPIKEQPEPKQLNAFTDKVELKDVSFHYVEGRDVLKHKRPLLHSVKPDRFDSDSDCRSSSGKDTHAHL